MPQTFTITVSGKGHFPCRTDQSIVDAGQQAGFGFPIACRNGVCERCIGQLSHGQVQQKNRTIHAGDASSSQVLYCIALPLSDCEIDAVSYTHLTLPTNREV